MQNLLNASLIRASDCDGCIRSLALPDLYVALLHDEVASFPALRPHQRHAWHAFLCQLGALACLRAGLKAPPIDAEGWRAILRALTPEFPGDEPWCLASPPQGPAFLQAPVPGGRLDGFKPLATPDELDMLVTAKNHDLKSARLIDAAPDDWLFALVTLQTMEGFLGAGNYGIARMNGGFANRPGLSMAPDGGVGAHVARDMRRLLELREDVLDDYPAYKDDGLALLWLEPWDGTTSLSPDLLDPYFIEVCRRVRLIEEDGCISALVTGSKAPRVRFSDESAGNTGDPWTPLETTKGGTKALTVDARGFGYRRLSDILARNGFTLAPLQTIGPAEIEERPYVLVCRAMARGQGKTEGFHERRIRVPPRALRCCTPEGEEQLAAVSLDRVKQAGEMGRILRRALMVLFQNGPDTFAPRDPGSSDRAGPFLAAFDRMVDADFFDHLFAEVAVEAEAEQIALRAAWLAELKGRARTVLTRAEAGSPTSALRRLRARVRAESALNAGFRRAFGDIYFPQEKAHDVA